MLPPDLTDPIKTCQADDTSIWGRLKKSMNFSHCRNKKIWIYSRSTRRDVFLNTIWLRWPSRENANTVNHSPGRDRSKIQTAQAIKGKTVFNNSTLSPSPDKPEMTYVKIQCPSFGYKRCPWLRASSLVEILKNEHWTSNTERPTSNNVICRFR